MAQGQQPPNPDRSHLLLLSELFLFSIGLASCLTMQVDRAQPTAYMDEIFHIPLAQKYCRGVFTDWDPKVTTPPGLYAMSSALLALAALLTGQASLAEWKLPDGYCSVFQLRLANTAYFAVSFLALYGILSSRRHYALTGGAMPEPRLRVLKAFCLALFPVSFFFVGLFYTDQASLACLLAAYFMQLNEHRLAAGLLACLAIACRQTNVVWLLFLLAVSLERDWLCRLRGIAKRAADMSRVDGVDDDDNADTDDNGDGGATNSLAEETVQIVTNWRAFVSTGLATALRCWPLLTGLVGFAAFVYANGGIALGDRSAHAARLHTPQLMYFLAFAVAMHPAAVLNAMSHQLPALLSRRLALASAIAVCGLCCLAVRYHTYEHPYLLADNRHLTFYVWHRLFRRHWSIRYLLTPCYVASLLAYWRAVRRSCLFRLALLACTAATLVPAGLLEPRYFIAPWLLWRLSADRHDSRRWLLFEAAYFASVNAAVYWLFFKRPFHWPGVSEVQRFIW